MGKCKNRVSLIGVVGKDAQGGTTASGVSYCRFSLATSKGGYKKQDGTEVPEVTQWHNIIAWRSVAEMASKYVKKGMKVAVDGEIVYGKYDKQGVSVLTVDIVADDIVLMSKSKDDAQQVQPYAQQKAQTDIFGGAQNDDMPF